MNWLTFTIFGLAAVVLQEGLRSTVRLGETVSPDMLLMLMVMIALLARPLAVMWAALLLGVTSDLLSDLFAGYTYVGPHAIGFMVGAYAVLQVRSMVFRESVLTLAFCVFFTGLLMSIIVVTFEFLQIKMHGASAPGYKVAAQFASAFGTVLYTALVSLVLGRLLFRTKSWWIADEKSHRSPWARG